jgi:hypothetical protein
VKQSVEQLPGRAGAAPAQPAAHREDPAAALVASVHRDPWGSVRPSLYETARVLSLAPWLDGADTRLAFVLDRQAADGSWGEGPVRYRLLPTLSAVEALLAQVRRAPAAAPAARPAAAAANGLAALRALPSTGPWPDTAAAEILVPALLARVHRHLDELAGDTDAPTVLGPWIRGERPAPPPAYRMEFPAAVADRIRAAHLPWKLHHTYEGVADHLGGRDLPGTEHLLGSSPAAAAAAASTGGAAERERTAARLAPIAARYGGLFPEAAPITVFERLWVGAALARAGLLADRERALVRGWADRIHDPAGVRGAPGLMADADDTSMALVTGLLTGANRDPAPLEAFARDGHYDCYPGEDTGSVTANAHAAQALALHLRRAPGGDPAAADRLRQVRGWLIERQEPQGHWPDKWHASPYYATARCVTALAGADQPGAAEAVARAADWAAGTRHADGSWGAWGGTAEETAYGVQILLGADPAGCDRDLLARSGTLLRQAADDPGHRHPALWHDKTLYAPLAMVRAEILAALAALGRHTGSADADGPAGPAGAAQ